jgi:fatty acid desaturase
MSVLGGGSEILMKSMERLGAAAAGYIAARLADLRATVRAEVRRAATATAFGIVAALLVVAAVEFAAIAILISQWYTHPVLAAASIAAGFLLLAIIAVVAMRRCTR